MTDRALKLHVARVHLSECARRRHHPANVHYYWHLFSYAQRCRRDAAAMQRTPTQTGLFA